MEQKIEKKMNGEKLDLNLNLKQNHTIQKKVSHLEQHQSLMSPMKSAKQKRSYNHKRKILKLRHYLNYKKSGMPKRIMFHQNGEWIDFPQDVVDLVRTNPMVKKTAVEVPFNGHNLVIDLLHLYQMDLKTGLQQPIGWLDDLGMFFFPEISFTSDEEPSNLCKHEHGDVHKAHGSNDIKLHLRVKVDRLDESKLKECSGDYDMLAKYIQIDAKTECGQYDVEIDNSDNKIDQGKVCEKHNQEQDLVNFTEPIHGKLDLDMVKKMFVKGMSSFDAFDIVEIFQLSSLALQDRLDVFDKQVEITKKHRGKANIEYAWLASSKEELSIMMKYGVGNCRASRTSVYGIGVHLSSIDYAYTSVNLCDVDENGVRYLVLCRVLLGRLELLHPGSKQFHPSSNEYDNGVDDAHPRHYVVWDMNANTNIYPEFVVSFKISSEIEGYLAVMEKMQNVSQATAKIYQGPMGLICSVASSKELESAPVSKPTTNDHRDPNSDSFFLPLLVEVLKNKVPPWDKERIEDHYEEFTSNRISREELKIKLIAVVGEELVRASLALLRIDAFEAFRNNLNPEGNINNN